jgi:hypothetical protein
MAGQEQKLTLPRGSRVDAGARANPQQGVVQEQGQVTEDFWDHGGITIVSLIGHPQGDRLFLFGKTNHQPSATATRRHD